jgi:hypothetical protein
MNNGNMLFCWASCAIPPGLAAALDGELQRFALAPTAAELEEGVAEVAREILAGSAAGAA